VSGPTRVLVVLGTRPEAIKLAPVVKRLRAQGDRFVMRLCVSGQHREMLDQMLHAFAMTPHVDLNLMRNDQTLAETTSRILVGMTGVLEEWRPHWMVVQGDTTTTMAAALAGFYLRVPVAHVEAGLRSGDRFAPFPEELNRRVTSVAADLHFAPTPRAAESLQRQGVPASSIIVTGNTAIDALLDVVTDDRPTAIDGLLQRLHGKRIVVVTAHRREHFGEPLERVCRVIGDLAARFPDVAFVYPVHLNPSVQGLVRGLLGDLGNVVLTAPLDYFAFAKLLRSCFFVMTDSGGIQEEAPSLGKPVLVLRDVTERQEAVDAGAAVLVGTDPDRIRTAAERLLTDRAAYARMVISENPFGDGRASERIVAAIGERSAHTRTAAAVFQ
jgi:UDP-N-acetylglucosamine 2-epimerase (non-hydrolysing)